MVSGDPPIIDRSSVQYAQTINGALKQKSTNRSKKDFEHVVRKGDTLYSIAWQYGISYRFLAARNSIQTPFVIYPGQKLYLKEVLASQENSRGRKTKKVSVREATRKTLLKNAQYWTWPVKSKPVAGFTRGNKGVDYSLSAATELLSASAGSVVYEGGGIGGYANLIIVKHSSELLSAYSFEGDVIVREQQRVSSGESLAVIKPTPEKNEKVHFEVRRNGRPINPSSLIKGSSRQ